MVVAFESTLQDISQCEVRSGVSDQRGLSQAFFHHLEQVARAPRTLRNVGVTVGLDPNAESASEVHGLDLRYPPSPILQSTMDAYMRSFRR